LLTHPTLDQLNRLGLQGMAKAFNDLAASDEAAGLAHADWLALLLEREAVHRQDRRLGARLRHARLRHHAVPEDIDYRAQRGIDRALLAALVKGDWIDAHDNLVITGPTGVGKSWLACALAIRPAATTALCSTSASPSCSTTWRSLTATAAPAAASRVSAPPSC
jgi:DNA replication protein DnaC